VAAVAAPAQAAAPRPPGAPPPTAKSPGKAVTEHRKAQASKPSPHRPRARRASPDGVTAAVSGGGWGPAVVSAISIAPNRSFFLRSSPRAPSRLPLPPSAPPPHAHARTRLAASRRRSSVRNPRIAGWRLTALAPLPETMASCGCLVLEKVEDHSGEAARGRVKVAPAAASGCGGSCAGVWRRRSEAIFPIYVMGSSRASTVAAARGILDSAEDPIWEAVKSEAKSEVSMSRESGTCSRSSIGPLVGFDRRAARVILWHADDESWLQKIFFFLALNCHHLSWNLPPYSRLRLRISRFLWQNATAWSISLSVVSFSSSWV